MEGERKMVTKEERKTVTKERVGKDGEIGK